MLIKESARSVLILIPIVSTVMIRKFVRVVSVRSTWFRMEPVSFVEARWSIVDCVTPISVCLVRTIATILIMESVLLVLISTNTASSVHKKVFVSLVWLINRSSRTRSVFLVL